MKDSDANLLREFAYRYNVSISETQQRVSLPVNVGYSRNYSNNFQIAYDTIPAFAVTIGEVQLLEIIEKLGEYEALMRDPESRRLIMEAKFMNRLKNGY